MDKQFTYLFRVRYSECDAQKVVFNAKYVEFMDVAITEYYRMLWGNYTFITNQGLDNQVVNVNVSWKAPALFDDIIAITVNLKKIGTTSFTYEMKFTNYQTKQLIATGEITYVMVSLNEHQKIAIPPKIRTRIEEGTAGLINHAGIKI